MKNEFTFQIKEGIPSKELLNEILVIYQAIFEDYKLNFFKERIHQKDDIIITLCYSKQQLIAFKIGYRYNEKTLYSWVGGVLSNFRKNGIAKKLAKLQEEYAVKKGYQKLRTKSMNRFRPMMILNLKNGFDIVNMYTNDVGQTKIVFEKKLTS